MPAGSHGAHRCLAVNRQEAAACMRASAQLNNCAEAELDRLRGHMQTAAICSAGSAAQSHPQACNKTALHGSAYSPAHGREGDVHTCKQAPAARPCARP